MIQALFDRLIVLQDPPKAQDGSIILSEAHITPPLIGTVVSTGAEISRLLAPGSRVIWGVDSGTEIEHENQKYVILTINDVLAIEHKRPT